MKRDRSDSGDKPKPRAAGRNKDDKKAAGPEKPARAAKPKPPVEKAKPAAAKPRLAARPPVEKPAPPTPRAKKAAPAPPVRTAPARARRAAAEPKAPKAPKAKEAPVSHKAEADFTDEQRIESAKYQTGEQPRVFEEERFIFPETYGHNRLRLLVKDPQWLFAHWDVDPGVFSGLRAEMGERAAALSRLTLKVEDPEQGGGAVIHLPEDARSWYVRADRVRRAYRAELGLTLPSGEYRPLATSNTVRTPAGSPSPRRASQKARYEGPRRAMPVEPAGDWPRAEAIPPPAAVPAAEAARRAGAAPGPWQPRLVEPRKGHAPADDSHGDTPEKGGASDAHGPLKPGASDLHRR